MSLIKAFNEIREVREELKRILINLRLKIARGQEITLEDLKELEKKI